MISIEISAKLVNVIFIGVFFCVSVSQWKQKNNIIFHSFSKGSKFELRKPRKKWTRVLAFGIKLPSQFIGAQLNAMQIHFSNWIDHIIIFRIK